jgi:hypothetical protein
VVNTAGGVITGLELKHYREADKTEVGLGALYKKITGQAKKEERPKKELGNVQLVPSYEGVDRKDMVAPLTVVPLDKELYKLAGVEYRANRESLLLGKDKPSETLVLSYTGPAGIMLEKQLTFHNDKYQINVTINTKGLDGYNLFLGTDFGIADKLSKDASGRVGIVALVDGKTNTDKLGSIKGEVQYSGAIEWFGQEDKYFTSTMLYADRGIVTCKRTQAPKEAGDLLTTGLTVKEKVGSHTFGIYAGPKSFTLLQAEDTDLSRWSIRLVRHSCQAHVLAHAPVLRHHQKLRHSHHPAYDRRPDPPVLSVAQERHGHGGDEKDPAPAGSTAGKIQEGPPAYEPGNDEDVQGAQGEPARRVPAHAPSASVLCRAL